MPELREHSPPEPEDGTKDRCAAYYAKCVAAGGHLHVERSAAGKVPGAVLLASFRKYDVKATLPESKDTPLVFYCSNKR